MDYMRAVLQRHELSQRALDLTRRIVFMNPSHYPIWYRP